MLKDRDYDVTPYIIAPRGPPNERLVGEDCEVGWRWGMVGEVGWGMGGEGWEVAVGEDMKPVTARKSGRWGWNDEGEKEEGRGGGE